MRKLGLLLLLLLPSSAQAGTGQALRWAGSQVGHREIGTSNCSARIKRWHRAMGLSTPPCRPWCGAYVHQAWLRGGVKLSARMIDPNRSWADARAGVRHLRAIPVSQVRAGDILFFRFRAGVEASHVALVRYRAGAYAYTYEGNVGHTVVATRRGLRYAVGAARVVR